MGDSMDDLHMENESASTAGETRQIATAPGEVAKMEQSETCRAPMLQTESGPGSAASSTEKDGSGCSSPPEGLTLGTSHSEDPAMGMLSASLNPPALSSTEPSETLDDPPPPRPSKVSIADSDCLICFNQYSAHRLPKVLACQHAFCAICLKLILRNEDRTWIISCPLCRKATIVFGGLICNLRDREDVVGCLESPDLDVEVSCPPDSPGASQANHRRVSGSHHTDGGSNRAAAQRLVMLLLLVAVLILFLLPFMYTGLLKWALCVVVVLGFIMSVVLCCNPSWRCPDIPLPSWRQKETQVASIA